MESKPLELGLLRSFSPLDGLKSENLHALARKTVLHSLAQGRPLFKEGDTDKRTYYVVTGVLELLHEGRSVLVIRGGSPEARNPVADGNFSFGEGVPDVGGMTFVSAQLVPYGSLALVVVGKREGHELFEADLLLAVEIDELRTYVGQFESALDDQRAHAESGRDVFHRLPCIDKRTKGLELVRRVHVLA